MKNTSIFIAGLVSALALTPAGAQTYQWKDSSGRTVISDTPPPGSTRPTKTLGSAPPPSNEFKPNDSAKVTSPKNSAEQDMEFKKRQQEAREKAEKAEKEQTAAREKQENCDRARRNLAALESDQAITQADEQGKKQALNDDQRQLEIERARKFLSDTCSK